MKTHRKHIHNKGKGRKLIEQHRVEGGVEAEAYAYLVGIFHSLPSRKSVKKALKEGLITVHGLTAGEQTIVKDGMMIKLYQAPNAHPDWEVEVHVVFEDEHFAVLNKAPGIPVNGNQHQTLERTLPFNLSPTKQVDALPAPAPVHRLDNPTSGLVICAKTKAAQVAFGQLFLNKEIKKTYNAFLVGDVSGRIDVLMPVDGKPAKSVIKPLWVSEKEEGKEMYSMVEMKPVTGRKHQLRLHSSWSGHPIMGDKEHGMRTKLKGRGMYLAATRLEFHHPITGEEMDIRIPMPKKFVTLQKLLSNPSVKKEEDASSTDGE
ncbi:MAG: RluA family pseudouridine synthase [Flavobacteriales bacterium]|nr:RluA family pseudouridine synthase [Flavobacteriales bacterium]MDG1780350.1 RluA family pseudouridine synthase [Flavobacteriales bacterium]MDG2246546.1 RluA family pseudouridine synthase [Flavobacteriales bacterium]